MNSILKFAVMALLAAVVASTSEFSVGTGIYDITGPAADANLFGYAVAGQKAAGIHLRVRSRAYAVLDNTSGKRFMFVSMDAGMGSDIVNIKVMEGLADAGLGDFYSAENVCISGTHTHSSPGGFLQHLLFQFPSYGFVRETLDAIVEGVVQSIVRAHTNLTPGTLHVSVGDVKNANINRSPTAYLLNPAEERAKYDANTDQQMVLLKMLSEGGNDLGMVNWFAVHGTSMNNTNRLVSGDNRGYASYMFEQKMNGPPTQTPTGSGSFVAAFASTNLGDVSPNTNGPHCQDTGLPCDLLHSTCNGKTQLCIASGPGKDMFESTSIIGGKQVDVAEQLYASEGVQLSGGVDHRFSFVVMPGLNVTVGTETKQVCGPALGYAFAAGTTDGPGDFDFTQGTTSGNPLWNLVSGIISKPTAEEKDCHSPKPILLNTQDCSFPYPWHPTTVPLQLLRVGQFAIIGAPGEFTTMAGRRLRDAVKEVLVAGGLMDEEQGQVVIAGLSNTYTSYIATFEEYQQQRYEGASTLYGPHTAAAYTQQFVRLAEDMVAGRPSTSAPGPADLLDKMYELLTPVVVDGVPLFKDFGDVTEDVKVVAEPKVGLTQVDVQVWDKEEGVEGEEKVANLVGDGVVSAVRGGWVEATFRSACPRNNRRQEGTFLTVERQTSDGWVVVATDSDWETRFHWYRSSAVSDYSYAAISWNIPSDAATGTYRLHHFGTSKNLLGHMSDFDGVTSTFTVTAS